MKKIIILPFFLLLILTGCSDKKTNTNEDVSLNNQEEITASDIEIKEFSLIAKNWSFEPSSITVNKGDLVKLKITSIDIKYGFYLPQFNVKSDLYPEEETIVEFTATKVGSFPFSCSVYCGSGHNNMKGVLIVK